MHEAVVIAHTTEDGQQQLIAYVTSGKRTRAQDDKSANSEAPPVTAADLRAFLKQKLPAYMIPALFVPLAALPLTTNGKVDRGALPLPTSHQGDTGAVTAPPQTPTEIALADIWAELLEIGQVGQIDRHADFFELGGHSLLATQVSSRIQEEFAVALPLRTLFTASTLVLLAEAVEVEQLNQLDDETFALLLAQAGEDAADTTSAQLTTEAVYP